MKALRIALVGIIFALLIIASTSITLAQCPEDDPNCPLEPPQSKQIDASPIDSEGSTGETDDPGALKPVESEIEGLGPTFIDPVPLGLNEALPPKFEKAEIPIRWQDPNDVSCGVQALGMAIDGLGGGAPTSDAILEHLQSNGMMYEFGTGVEELAFTAQNFGYKGTKPFHNWTLENLQDELSEGRAPVVALGANGEGQPGHFVTVTGVSPDGKWVSYNDPTLGEQTITVEEFERLWGLQGNSGVAVRKTVPAGEEDLVPWVAMVATLMAIISQTPLALRRMGVGGKLVAAGGGSTRRRVAQPYSRFEPPKPQPNPPRDPSPQMRNDAPERGSIDRLKKFVRNHGTISFTTVPVLESVPEFTSDPGGWIQAKIINLGRKKTSAREFIAGTLGPMAEELKSYDDPERHPFMASVRESTSEEEAALLGAAVLTPGIQDDAPIALWIGIVAVGTYVLHQMGTKNTLMPGDPYRRKDPAPQVEMLQPQIPSSPRNGFEPDQDPNKGLKDVVGKILTSEKVPGIAKILVYIGTIVGVVRSLSGEEAKEKNKHLLAPTETQTPDPSPTGTPTASPTPTPTDTPTPTGTPTPSPSPTPTPTPSPAPTAEPTFDPRGIAID